MNILSLRISDRHFFSNEENHGQLLISHRDRLRSLKNPKLNNAFVCGFLMLIMVSVTLNMVSGTSDHSGDASRPLLDTENGIQFVHLATIPWRPHPKP